MDKFRGGTASVLELNTARAESDAARRQYITDIGNFWNYYYTLRQCALFDLISGEDLAVNEEELIGK